MQWFDVVSKPGPVGTHPTLASRNEYAVTAQFATFAAHLRARFGTTERGASLVEYALLVALIAVVCIAAVTLLGKSDAAKFNAVGASLGAS